MKRDDLHYSLRTLQGYDKTFNFVISEREVGKSTTLWLDLVYKAYKEGKTSIVLRRQIADITEAYLNDTEAIINKFIDDPIKITYIKGSLKDGIVDVYVHEKDIKKLLFRCIALSNPVARIKSLIVPNLKYIVMDEFIINPKFKEKYLEDESTRFKELYNTFQRETSRLKAYFFGNPYSLYNPYFIWLGADSRKLKRGTIQSGKNWIIECYQMKDELRELILKRNPLYEFDDAYTRYAFDGESINDSNIKLGELQPNYSLRFVFKIDGKYLGVYRGNYAELQEDRYFCKFIDSVSARRTIYCFDFSELVERTCILSLEDRQKFSRFKTAMRKRLVSFETIESYYLIQEIYFNL